MGGSAQHGRILGGRYEIVKHLASGGMAQVLLARTIGIEGFERYVVVKQIHVERASDPKVVKMFIDEARLAASLHHANIVQVHDIGQDEGDYYFTMEYLHGEDLRSLLHKLSLAHQTLPLEHVITIISSAAAALHHAHEQRGSDRRPLGLVHRDVSPANVFVCYDGTVKMVDFGIAKAAHRSTETNSGTLKGKISYMAPEQCMGLEVDRRSDVYALGIVLYELYTVRRLFKGSSEFLTMSAIVSGEIPRPSLHRPDIPRELEQIMLKALALRREDRFQTTAEMRIALDRLAERLGLRTSTTGLADYMETVIGRRPEPWLDDEDVVEPLDVDFDGSGSGLAVVPQEVPAGVDEAAPGSPMARARSRAEALTPSPFGKHQIRLASTPPGAPDPGDDHPTTASGTPMAWVPTPSVKPKRRWPLLAAGLSVIAIAVVVATQIGASGQAPAPAAAAAPEPMPPPAAIPPAPPAPEAPPAVVEPPSPPTAPEPAPTVPEPPPPPAPTVAEPAPAVAPAHAVTPPPHHAKPTKPSKAKPAAAPTEDYDPDALFLKKGSR